MAPITFAHRGGVDGGFAENSLDAFADALARGCQLETDLRLSADREVVCVHDSFSFVGRRPVWVAHMSAATLRRRRIPTLRELYRQLGTDFELSADLKATGVAGPALAVARQAGALRRLWLVSDDLDLLVAVRADSPEVRLIHEARRRDLEAQRMTQAAHLVRLAAAHIDAANTTAGDWTPGLVDDAHRLGLRAFGSLLQDRPSMDRAVSLGLDGFYSDHLDLMRAAVGDVRG